MLNPFLLHPLIQVVGAILGAYALWLGAARFQDRRTGRTPPRFAWKRHVAAGKAAVILWLTGIAVAVFLLAVVYGVRPGPMPHIVVGFLAIPVALAVLFTGAKLNGGGVEASRRAAWAAAHGLVALLLCAMVVFQAVSGAIIIFA